MEWLLFSYWLPPDPSRKRVYTWRQLKKLGALSTEGGGWLLPKTEGLASSLTNLGHAVEDMGGTANLYTATHFSKEQEERAIQRIEKEREKEYAGIITECQKALTHIEWEFQRGEYNFEEVEELECDLEKIRRWYNEVKKRDFWNIAIQKDVDNAMSSVEDRLGMFIQTTYEETSRSGKENLEAANH